MFENCDLKISALTFGDAIAANVIEQIMIYFVTQKTENKLTKIFLKFYRFVDDFAMGNANKQVLLQAGVDLQIALNSLDFHLKRILSKEISEQLSEVLSKVFIEKPNWKAV